MPHARWLLAVLAYTLTPLALLYLPGHARAVDPAWDFGMALGVLAAGGVALLPLLSARWWGAQYPAIPFLRLLHEVHLRLAYVLTVLALLHVTVLCVLEPRVLEYLTPRAPWPMLAGLMALVLFIFLCLSSRWRLQLGWRQASWRHWHAGLSALALTGMAWHIVDAGYYFNRWSAAAALLWMLAVPTLLSLWLRGHPLARVLMEHSPRGSRLPGARRIVSSIALVWLLLAAVWVGLGRMESPLLEASPCASNPCL
ncbi:MAG: hypothetical protein FJ164_06155 [Gammaproteobacteria bacterium]|nr:hypothetical protein [Gammaproteobacteria bacterium]